MVLFQVENESLKLTLDKTQSQLDTSLDAQVTWEGWGDNLFGEQIILAFSWGECDKKKFKNLVFVAKRQQKYKKKPLCSQNSNFIW